MNDPVFDGIVDHIETFIPRANFSTFHAWVYQAMMCDVISGEQYRRLMQTMRAALSGRKQFQFRRLWLNDDTAMPKDGVYAALSFFRQVDMNVDAAELLLGVDKETANKLGGQCLRLYRFFTEARGDDLVALDVACSRHVWTCRRPPNGVYFEYDNEWFWIPGEYGDNMLETMRRFERSKLR